VLTHVVCTSVQLCHTCCAVLCCRSQLTSAVTAGSCIIGCMSAPIMACEERRLNSKSALPSTSFGALTSQCVAAHAFLDQQQVPGNTSFHTLEACAERPTVITYYRKLTSKHDDQQGKEKEVV
jgi:hypothetical protein